MRLLIAGATGLVGRHVLALALADARVEQVIAPVRRPIAPHARLRAPVVDFDDLPPDAPWWRVDAAACTLGSTMRAAGSQAAFRRVDFDYSLAIARLVQRHGARAFALNSALGANARSRIFYNRVKGETEDAILALGFASVCLVRPGMIGGERGESRPAERAGLLALRAAGPLLPRRWRINPAPRIAEALLEAAIARAPGVEVVESAALAA